MRGRVGLSAFVALVILAAGNAWPGDYKPVSRAVIAGSIFEGRELQIDLPLSEHVKNIGAPRDGLGLCVFASMSMDARWHNIRELSDVIHKVETGGGWPEKVAEVIEMHAPNLRYVQYEGTSPAILDQALSTGHAACVTYGYGERYGQTIYHMVMLVYLDTEKAAILDNNFPGTYEWMDRSEFLRRWAHPSGKGWCFVLLAPTPPPIPTN